MPRPRTYKLKRNAERRKAALDEQYPYRKFWVAPTQDFRWAVFTTRQASKTDPNSVGVICS